MTIFSERFNRRRQGGFADREEEASWPKIHALFNAHLFDCLERYNGQRPHRGYVVNFYTMLDFLFR